MKNISTSKIFFSTILLFSFLFIFSFLSGYSYIPKISSAEEGGGPQSVGGDVDDNRDEPSDTAPVRSNPADTSGRGPGGGGTPGGPQPDSCGMTGVPLCGFAWSATNEGTHMGSGWLSFSSTDTGSSVPYGVGVSPTGHLNGCAWSPHIGWVKFGGLAAFPFTFSTARENARISGTDIQNGDLIGFARACVGTQNGDCSNMTSRTDGWDGWISLTGLLPSYGVDVDNGIFSGYSWGHRVIGWLKWAPSGAPDAAWTGGGVRFCSVQLPDFNLDAPSPVSVAPGGSVNVVVSVGPRGTQPFPTSVSLARTNPAAASGVTSSIIAAGPCTGTCQRTLRIDASSSAPEGSSVVRVTGTGTYSGGSIVRTKDITVNVAAVTTPNVTCEPPAGYPTQPVYVNRPVNWRVRVAAGTPGFTYTPVFDTVEGSSRTTAPGDGLDFDVQTTYSTIGRKTFQVVNLEDSAGASGGFCDPVDIIVRVNPDIEER